jgi:hypothetical protein
MREQVFLFCVLGLLLTAMIILMIALGPVTWAVSSMRRERALAVCLLRRLWPSPLTQSLGAARRDLNPHLQRDAPSACGTALLQIKPCLRGALPN